MDIGEGRQRGTARSPACILVAATILLAFAATSVHAQDLSDLRARIERQEQELEALRRNLDARSDAKLGSEATSGMKLGAKGFSIQSNDGANVLKLRGVLQTQGRWYTDDITASTADTLLLRRVRPTLEGTLGGIYDFRLTPDFAGSSTIILDAYIAARFKPWATLTIGKFKPPVGLERLQSLTDTRFAERGMPSFLVPNRDLGIQLGGHLGAGVHYAFGYFNGVADGGRSDAQGDVENDSSGDWAARIFAQPFQESSHSALSGLGFGLGGSYGSTQGNEANTLLPSYRTSAQQVFFRYRGGDAATYADGERLRLAAQAYYYLGSFGLLAEYVRVSQDVARASVAGVRSETLDHDGWQVAASWFLTGEAAQFKGFTPNSTFAPGNSGTGAWELAVRYHGIDIDDAAFTGGDDSFANPNTAASEATAFGVGLNWYLNTAVKWTLNYERTRFGGGASDGADRRNETAVFTQFSVAF